jgi:periplasmic protein CpxP/Spy
MKSLKNLMSFKSQTTKKYMTVLAAASLASFASLAVFAEAADAEKKITEQVQHHKHHGDINSTRGGHPGRDYAHLGAKLDLTDAQKETLKAARTANKASTKELHEKLRTAHNALDKAIAANADDAMLNKLTTDLASLIAQKELARAKAHRDFLNLLTPEQKQKLASLKAERKNAPHWKDKNASH